MKRIICFNDMSKIDDGSNDATRIMRLYDHTRSYYRTHDVKGVMLVSGHHVLQIIESSSDNLAAALYQFGRYQQVENLTVIASAATDAPIFKNWAVKSLDSSTPPSGNFLGKLNAALDTELSINSQAIRDKVNAMIERIKSTTCSNSNEEASAEEPASKAREINIEKYSNQLISLRAWPRPNQIRLDHDVMKLCSLLTRHPVLYERLKEQDICEEAKLVQYLDQFSAAGILSTERLLISRSQKNADVTQRSANPKNNGGRFSNLLRKFILTSLPG